MYHIKQKLMLTSILLGLPKIVTERKNIIPLNLRLMPSP